MSSELACFQIRIENFTANLLSPYLTRLPQAKVSKTPKELNDPLWGTIVLYPLELVVLDSPLLQRLRRIKQLGVVHWVYPGATHSRIEHTIGAVHQIQRLITSINSRSPESEADFIDKKMSRLLRLIALCHDIGQGVMSHVSENAFRNLEEVEQIRLDFVDLVNIERTKLSEIAAYYMIGSPTFKEMLRLGRDLTNSHDLPADAVNLIQKAIVGHPISDEIPLLHELISGPFDADKLDYMPRDAQMAGVPVVTDVNRLIEKVRAIRVTQGELPLEVAKAVKGGKATYTMTGIVLSGGRTLDELMLGRTLLFDKIYRHQKVRALESMVSSILLALAPIVDKNPAFVPYLWTDDELLEINKERIEHLIGRPLEKLEEKKVAVAIDIATRLKDRRLFVRAFAFSQSMPLDPKITKDHVRGLERLIREARDIRHRGKLVTEIVEEMKALIKTLGREDVLVEFADADLVAYIWIDPPEQPPPGGNILRAYLIADNRRIIRFKEESAETHGWADAYILTRDIGYIFVPDSISPFVFLAAEKLIRHEYGVRIPTSMLSYAKQDVDTIAELRKQLDDKKYYRASPHDLRPLPGRLGKADIRPRLEAVKEKLGAYSGIDPDGKLKFNASRIEDWLRQFEADDLIESALNLVEKVKLIGRKEVVAALKEFLDSNKQYHGAFLCPLGTPKDSSGIATYYAGDIAKTYDLRITTLEDAIGYSSTAPIVFVDDFIGRGSQAISIIENNLGIPQSVDLKEDRGKPLDNVLIENLKKRPLAFVFSAGSHAGKANLEKRASEIGLNVKVSVHLTEENLPQVFGSGKMVQTESDFRRKCEDIGKSLLVDGTPGHDADWATDKLLGYGNNAFLVIFPYNTPTQTLTCLWKEGSVDGRQWTPLFPRRKKE